MTETPARKIRKGVFQGRRVEVLSTTVYGLNVRFVDTGTLTTAPDARVKIVTEWPEDARGPSTWRSDRSGTGATSARSP